MGRDFIIVLSIILSYKILMKYEAGYEGYENSALSFLDGYNESMNNYWGYFMTYGVMLKL